MLTISSKVELELLRKTPKEKILQYANELFIEDSFLVFSDMAKEQGCVFLVACTRLNCRRYFGMLVCQQQQQKQQQQPPNLISCHSEKSIELAIITQICLANSKAVCTAIAVWFPPTSLCKLLALGSLETLQAQLTFCQESRWRATSPELRDKAMRSIFGDHCISST